ncbi:hypothetical protein D9M70_589590 [compost metagenome]
MNAARKWSRLCTVTGALAVSTAATPQVPSSPSDQQVPKYSPALRQSLRIVVSTR